ncbi:helix-turn-helix domain-containing protein [Streptomyces sp. NPDC093060]|uniref:helix-turn-helix domain-containing protein n=1 Tax=Streptomyces sp. NPDC093060 TaxID=3366019 RepID=UPI0037FFD315
MATEKQHAWNSYRGASRPPYFQRPKLTPQQREEIRRRLEDGERAVDLAAEYGVSRGAIGHCR